MKLSADTDTITEAPNLIDALYKKDEIQNKLQYRKALDKFYRQKWNYRIKPRADSFFNRLKTAEPMLIVMDKSTREETLSKPLQTINKQFKVTVYFQTG